MGQPGRHGDTISTDYLVRGTGAVAMAFVDTLLEETSGEIVMVDRRDHPGGHWNDAYPFVHLHQPSSFYGVGSKELGRARIVSGGPNAGLQEMASRDEILDYYDEVMRHRFLPSGRVRWFPMSEHLASKDGRHRIRSLLSGAERDVEVRRKFVDATLTAPEIPLTHRPRYTIAPGAEHVSINGLPLARRPHPRYTIIGAGKSGMDACLWLLGNGVEPERLRWVVPRDLWMLNRADYQPSAENFERMAGAFADQFRCIAEADSVSHLFELLESRRHLLRLTSDVEPQAYHCATVTEGELRELRRIGDVVRLGRVTGIERDGLVLERGRLAADPDTLYVDCSASAITPSPDVAMFDGATINPLWVHWCQPLFSAAIVAFVEGRFADDDTKNRLCRPVSAPRLPIDWLRTWGETLANMGEWQKHPDMMAWLAGCRLNNQNAMQRGLAADDERRGPAFEALAARAAEAAARIPALLSGAGPAQGREDP